MEYYRNVRLSPEMEEAAAKVQESFTGLRGSRAGARTDAYGSETEELTAE